ncbi:MAG: hypothetical protein U0T83_08030 [Bacteriovoracaceae bacterium]
MNNFLILLTLLFLACGKDPFKRVEELNSFRVLAITTSSPELNILGSLNTTVTPYISDINGGGRITAGTVEMCLDPGVTFGAEVKCDHDPYKYSSSYNFDSTTYSNNLYSGLGSSVTLTLPNYIFSGKSEREKYNGVAVIVIFTFSVDNLTVKAFRRILVTNRTTLNQNPTVTQINVNGSAITQKPNKNDEISLSYGNVESYNYEQVDGTVETKSESFKIAWFTSSGNINYPKTEVGKNAKYTSQPNSGSFLIVGVVRDDRGGVSIIEKKF